MNPSSDDDPEPSCTEENISHIVCYHVRDLSRFIDLAYPKFSSKGKRSSIAETVTQSIKDCEQFGKLGSPWRYRRVTRIAQERVIVGLPSV
jgi:hypothetical protein